MKRTKAGMSAEWMIPKILWMREAEVVDPRTLNPLDVETIVKSVKKTGRLLVVYEATRTAGFGAEIIATVCDAGLRAKIKRVASENAPIPYSKPLERRIIPDREDIVRAALALVKRSEE